MDALKILEQLEKFGVGNIAVIGIILASLIQVTPLKINPWSKLFKWMGKLINGDVMREIKEIKEDIENLHKELDEAKEEEERREANNARNRILRFDDELRRKIDHSEEFFNQALDDVTFYRHYCDSHEGYPNSKADSAMTNIEQTYHECKRDDKFI